MTRLWHRVKLRMGADLGWLLAIVAVALMLRVYLPWPLVFTTTHVNLLESDAWYHLRVIEHLAANFPHRLQWDPYALPGGSVVGVPPLFDYLVASVAWVAGLGHPSQTLVTICTAFAPPVLGALTVVMVYVVARLAGGRLAGLFAAAMAATLPGHFLDRTLLGFADHHALESFVSVCVLALVAWPLSVRDDGAPRGGSALRAGVWLGMGLVAFRLAWTSSAMFVGLLAVWIVLLAVVQAWRPGGRHDVARIAGIAAAVAAPFTVMLRHIEPTRVEMHLLSLAILATAAAAIEVSRHGRDAGWWSRRTLIALGTALIAAAAAGVWLVAPSIVADVLNELTRFTILSWQTPVLEARALLAMDATGSWSLAPVWTMFRAGFALGLGGIAFLAVRWWRHGRPVDVLLIVWTAALFVATIGVNRFGYYLVPAIAIVGGCACAWAVTTAHRAGGWRRHVTVAAVAAAAIGVNLVPAMATTVRPGGIPFAWFPAFEWLRDQSAEPFDDPAYYLARYDRGLARRPSSTVMLWWDYGYGLIAAARRVPTALPNASGAVEAGTFFTAVDEATALPLLGTARERYVFVDEQLPFTASPQGLLVGKFQGITYWSGQPTSRFYDTFLVREGSTYRPVFLFFEDYYRTMAFRLGVGGGEAVASPPNSSFVVTWTIENIPDLGPSRVVSKLEYFATYEDAQAAMQKPAPGNRAIVGQDPRVSPVPLDRVHGLQRVFQTPAPGTFRQGAVQIFLAR
ncbi:MAG: hypothetical protein KA205_03100 [Acidobacteria bacterium]|nr:hypothetical protein [Acidobacteriota bacterium]